MKVPLQPDRLTRSSGSAEGTSRASRQAQAGLDAFQKILETQLAPGGGSSTGKPSDIPDEKTIRKLIEVIRLRMMMDEHLLESMRDSGSDQSLYQRFSRWQLSGLGAPAPSVPQAQSAPELPTPSAAEEVPSVIRLRKTSDRARAYEPIIREAAQTYNVDPNLIRAVIRAESNFKSESISPKGAMGLMQIMPETAKDLGIGNAYDPRENIMGGTRYLKTLLDRYRGDVTTALAAYNWGMGNVERKPEKLPRETKVYVDRIQQYMGEEKA